MTVKKGELFPCARCSKPTIKRTSGPQKYCLDCSAIKDAERKRRWAKDNPTPNEYFRSHNKKNKEISSGKGIEINTATKKSIFWLSESDEDLGLNTVVRVGLPFQYGISKNAAWSMKKGGHVYLRKDHKSYRDIIELKIKTRCRDVRFYEDKIWIDIFVQKPNHQGDAINVIDAVCDAVKSAIGVDDRWFSIRRLDWEVVKQNPMIYIGIGQASDGHKRICSKCGRILSLEMFWKDKSDRLGVGRECKQCMTKTG